MVVLLDEDKLELIDDEIILRDNTELNVILKGCKLVCRYCNRRGHVRMNCADRILDRLNDATAEHRAEEGEKKGEKGKRNWDRRVKAGGRDGGGVDRGRIK